LWGKQFLNFKKIPEPNNCCQATRLHADQRHRREVTFVYLISAGRHVKLEISKRPAAIYTKYPPQDDMEKSFGMFLPPPDLGPNGKRREETANSGRKNPINAFRERRLTVLYILILMLKFLGCNRKTGIACFLFHHMKKYM
jgi:hypothetical protein